MEHRMFLFKERVTRAMEQRMYLLHHEKKGDVYEFNIEGSIGTPYIVTVSTSLKCSCPDFNRRNKICKHIIFIVHKVYKINITDDNPKINLLANFNKLDLNHLEDCSICFDSTYNGKKCNICTGVFHSKCIGIWLRINKNCPICRSKW